MAPAQPELDRVPTSISRELANRLAMVRGLCEQIFADQPEYLAKTRQVFSLEQVIDAGVKAWLDGVTPEMLKRFPG